MIYPETAKQGGHDMAEEFEAVTEISIAVDEDTVEVVSFEPSESVKSEEQEQDKHLKDETPEGPIFVTSISVVSETAVTSPTTTVKTYQSTSTEATTTTTTIATTTTTTSTTTVSTTTKRRRFGNRRRPIRIFTTSTTPRPKPTTRRVSFVPRRATQKTPRLSEEKEDKEEKTEENKDSSSEEKRIEETTKR